MKNHRIDHIENVINSVGPIRYTIIILISMIVLSIIVNFTLVLLSPIIGEETVVFLLAATYLFVLIYNKNKKNNTYKDIHVD